MFSCSSDHPFVIERQDCSLSAKPLVSTTLHYTITVCCNRTAHSKCCLPASVEARELNLKYARTTEELNPGSFAPATEYMINRPPRPHRQTYLYTNTERDRQTVRHTKDTRTDTHTYRHVQRRTDRYAHIPTVWQRETNI